MGEFYGKVAVVTGGARGIGRAIARRFAESGAKVVLADVSPAGVDIAEAWQAERLKVAFVQTDVTLPEATEEMARFAERVYGGIDILVNCAGVFPRGTLLETDEALWDRVMDINLKGVFHACRAAVPRMVARGQGVIVNIGSLNAFGGAPNLFAYSVAKGGVWTLTRNLAKALAPYRIRVNCVHPGWVITEGEAEVQRALGMPDDWAEQGAAKIPLGRLQTPEDIAPTVLFLASDAASQITGQSICVDGGLGLVY
ncbi:putative oxidoreductase [Alicyclobacillus cellulosilyticus]|uniref:Oxidoreductase n=1 Tax=Alicyclobacillus cellulosilyticus TaxID=1003997 RepID=A0A917K9L8_9BACL|nr:SDR family NAD(P)-dependent oxidoreductase [Alicyclobacillus cellulosilyticus]GGJ05475.1 putative oxidoreductase [Alicyclobacillus cellulosilyticus]